MAAPKDKTNKSKNSSKSGRLMNTEQQKQT